MSENESFRAGGHFLNAILERPDDPVARLAFAQAKVASGEFEAALRAVRTAVRIGGVDNDTWSRASTCQAPDALTAQVDLLSRRAAKDPNDADRILLLGLWHRLRGSVDEAATCFGRARKLRPHDPLLKAALDPAEP